MKLHIFLKGTTVCVAMKEMCWFPKRNTGKCILNIHVPAIR